MKHLISLILAVVLAIGLFGCTGMGQQDKPKIELAQEQADTKPEKTEDILVTPEEPEQQPQPTANVKGEAYEVVYTKGTVYTNSIGTTWIQIIVQIENTGSEALYLKSSSVDLEDADGKLVDTKTYISAYPEVLLPGETAVLEEDTTLDSDPGVSELKVIPHLDIVKAKVECIRYTVSETSLSTDKYGELKMTGRVENNTAEAESMVYVVANLYDAEHHAIGQLFTILTNELKPGEKVGFSLSCLSAPDSLTEDSVASYEVFSFPVQFQF